MFFIFYRSDERLFFRNVKKKKKLKKNQGYVRLGGIVSMDHVLVTRKPKRKSQKEL